MIDRKYRLLIMLICSFIAGLVLIIMPSYVSDWVIRLVGISWIFSGIGYALDLWLVILNERY